MQPWRSLFPVWSQSVVPCPVASWHAYRFLQKNIYFCFIDYAKAFDCLDHNKLWKILLHLLAFSLKSLFPWSNNRVSQFIGLSCGEQNEFGLGNKSTYLRSQFLYISATTQLRWDWTHCLLIEITHMISGLKISDSYVLSRKKWVKDKAIDK